MITEFKHTQLGFKEKTNPIIRNLISDRCNFSLLNRFYLLKESHTFLIDTLNMLFEQLDVLVRVRGRIRHGNSSLVLWNVQ
jgi:hypothetical protein